MTFNGLQLLSLTGRVMTPRATSEQLVHAARERIGHRAARVVDVGTGGGALAIAIALASPHADVWATDIVPSCHRATGCDGAAVIHIATRRTPPMERLIRLREPRIHATPPPVLAASATRRPVPGRLWDRPRIGGDAIQCREQLVALVLERGDDTREAAFAFTCQPNPRPSPILIAGLTNDQTSLFGPTNGAGDSLRFDAQPFGDVGERRALVAARCPLDHQKQEIALRRQVGGPRRFFGGVLELPQGGAEARDRDVVRVLFGSSHYEVISSYYEVIPP